MKLQKALALLLAVACIFCFAACNGAEKSPITAHTTTENKNTVDASAVDFLNDGYLTITAVKGHEEDEKNKAGKIIRQERYSGSMSRSFYVGDTLTVDEIHGKYEGGVLTLNIPKKEEEKKVEHPNRIMIE